jgi:tRNA isopentenyl-2-thiomethyl-A-37 hydroxylase MiaE
LRTKSSYFLHNTHQRYSDKEKLVNGLSPIVTEEWGHFRLVLAELEKENLEIRQATEKMNM